jgi:ligand-binding sensor domain-containing protein
VEDGLPHNYVMAVLPAPDGYLLVGTDEGLARFDGVRFLPCDLDATLGLSKRWVVTMVTARDGSLWLGTFDGGLYQWRDGKVITRLEQGASVFSILEDSAGNIWASTRNGVIRSSGGKFEAIQQLTRPPDTAWNVLAQDGSGTVWIVCSDGLYRSRHQNIERMADSHSDKGDILAVYADQRGDAYVGTSTGLFRLSVADGVVHLLRVPLVSGPVVSILRDRDSGLWAGTWGNGLYRITGDQVQSWSSRDGLPDNFVRTLFEDQEGNIWAGLRGGGLNCWKNPDLVPVGIQEGLSGDFASTVMPGLHDDLWLGTWRGGLYRWMKGKLTTEPTPVPTLFFTIRALAKDPGGSIWLGNWEGLWRFDGHHYQYFGGPETPYHHVAAVLFDRRGGLWIGTSDDGIIGFPAGMPEGAPLYHFLPKQEITALQEDIDGRVWVGSSAGVGWISNSAQPVLTPVFHIGHDAIASLSEDSKHRIWACTVGGALMQLGTLDIITLDAHHGLPKIPLYRALDDHAGSLWVSSPKGILRLPMDDIDRAIADRTSKIEVTMYGQEDGMRTVECRRLSQPAGGRDHEGNLWFPTTKGFVRIRPGLKQAPKPPPVFIEEAALEGAPLAAGSGLQLPAGSHNLEIHFTALHFASPEKVRFRYRMEGFDPDWIPDAGVRTSRYNRLPAGTYRFAVRASLPGGSWSEPATITVQQLPSIPETRWFRALLILALCAAIAGLFRWRVHIVKQQYAAVITERNRISREWHDTLVAGFSAISLQIDAALPRLGKQSDTVGELLEVTRKMVHHYRAEARRVIWDLRDNRPSSESLVDAVSSAVLRATDGKNIEASVTMPESRFQALKTWSTIYYGFVRRHCPTRCATGSRNIFGWKSSILLPQ